MAKLIPVQIKMDEGVKLSHGGREVGQHVAAQVLWEGVGGIIDSRVLSMEA